MCWVAVDRGIRLADKRSFPCDRSRWLDVRDRIYNDIMTNGWHEERQAFVQAYDSKTLDAANLMMPRHAHLPMCIHTGLSRHSL